MKISTPVLLAFLFHAAPAFSVSLEVSDQFSSDSQYKTAQFSISSEDFIKDFDPERNISYDLDLTYNGSVSKTVDVTNSQVEESKTNDTAFDVTWNLANSKSIGAGLASRFSTADQMAGFEINTSYSYQHHYGPKHEAEEFSPSFSSKIGLGRNAIQQKFAGKRSAQKLKVMQTWVELSFNWQAVEWVTPYVSYKKYLYDRDTAELSLSVDHSSSGGPGGSFVSTTPLSLSESASSLGFTFHYGKFNFDVSHAITKSITGTDDSTTTMMEFTYFLSHWALALGAGQSASSGSDPTRYVALGAKYTF